MERHAGEKVAILEYYDTIMRIKAEVESFTGREWSMLEYPDYSAYLGREPNQVIPKEAYEYMAHLRHHGFPSPLLDWTTSPYIAAYFAFRSAPSQENGVAVYAFVDSPHGFKGGEGGEPRIELMGPYVRTHRRHYLQKSLYTLCWKQEHGESIFWPHGSVFATCNPDQDLLWKFVLPAEIRARALRSLEEMNLNSFSLFGTEDSLMETCSAREYLLGRGAA